MVKRALDAVIAGARARAQRARRGAARIAIRVESEGPRSIASAASGRAAPPFEIYKLRTMVPAPRRWAPGLAVDQGDARITRTGAMLRRLSIDELPNLVNVLRGEMSLVGPRPTVQVQVDRYTDAAARAARGAAGHHRLGADQRPRVAAVGTSGSSSTSGTSSTAR